MSTGTEQSSFPGFSSIEVAILSSDCSPSFRDHYLSNPVTADLGSGPPKSRSSSGSQGDDVLGHYFLSGKLSQPVNGRDRLRWEEIRSDLTIPEDDKDEFRKVIKGLSLTQETRKELCATMNLLMLERGIGLREPKATFTYRGHTIVSEWQKQYDNGFRLKVLTSSDGVVDDSQNCPDLSLNFEVSRENCLQVESALVQSMTSRLGSSSKETRKSLALPVFVSVAKKEGGPQWGWADSYRSCETSENAEEELRIQLEDMFKRA
jgi:hypothetical protein